jgi:hypothetical protein
MIFTLFISNNASEEISNFESIKENHLYLNSIVREMRATNNKFWQGNFWTAYRISAISKEDLKVDSYTVKRYYPYWLSYYNENKSQNNNFVFLTGELDQHRRQNLLNLLDKFKVKAKIKNVNDCWLVYDIEGNVLPKLTLASVPEKIPHLELNKINVTKGYLHLIFKNRIKSDLSGFMICAEITDYSSVTRSISLDQDQIKIKIPFPDKNEFQIKHYLKYLGLKIPETLVTIKYTSPKQGTLKKRRKGDKITYLSGFGAKRKIDGSKMTTCGREVKIEINRILKKAKVIYLHLYSPLDFDHPYWYGTFHQHLTASLNGVHLKEMRLDFGKNVLALNIEDFHPKKKQNILSLKFRYALPLPPTPLWLSACLLEKIIVE